MSGPRFGVMILNMNGARWLPALYEDLRTDGYADKRIYLVDNGSTDGSQALTRDRYPEVTVLQMPRNMGYSMAYNAAAEAAVADGCDWLIWQNNDTRVLPGWLDRFAAVGSSDPRIGVMGPVFREWSSDGPNFLMRARHPDVVPFMDDTTRAPVDTDWVEGSALAVRRECLDAVGPLDPSLFMYWEEADFCRRARYQGWRVVLVPGAIVRHFGGGTSGEATAAANCNSLKSRNYFVYTFCDPTRSLFHNAWAAVHLFLVNTKAAFRAAQPVLALWFNVRVFAWFLAGMPSWCAKWARDRKRGRPPRFSQGHEISLRQMLAANGSTHQAAVATHS